MRLKLIFFTIFFGMPTLLNCAAAKAPLALPVYVDPELSTAVRNIDDQGLVDLLRAVETTTKQRCDLICYSKRVRDAEYTEYLRDPRCAQYVGHGCPYAWWIRDNCKLIVGILIRKGKCPPETEGGTSIRARALKYE